MHNSKHKTSYLTILIPQIYSKKKFHIKSRNLQTEDKKFVKVLKSKIKNLKNLSTNIISYWKSISTWVKESFYWIKKQI